MRRFVASDGKDGLKHEAGHPGQVCPLTVSGISTTPIGVDVVENANGGASKESRGGKLVLPQID
jgi:hypothetical protein